jgi:hypothetical protein
VLTAILKALHITFNNINGSDVMVRVPRPLEPTSLKYKRQKLSREAEVLRWIAGKTTIPVPQVLQDAHDAQIPFLATTMCEGASLAWSFGMLSHEAQVSIILAISLCFLNISPQIENLVSHADIMLQLFRLDCPQVIGSVEKFVPASAQQEERLSVGTCIGTEGVDSPSTFSHIRDYFAWLIAVQKEALHPSSWTAEDQERGEQFWTRLEALVSKEISRIPQDLLRIVPVHEDFVAHNVVINSIGRITGVFDWEFHSLLPAVLAAGYPSWITYSGTNDPQFTSTGGNFSSFWFSSPEGAQHLRDEYDSVRTNRFPAEDSR